MSISEKYTEIALTKIRRDAELSRWIQATMHTQKAALFFGHALGSDYVAR